jgi:hypothetical protein
VVTEPLEQRLQVGAASGGEDGDAGHEILIELGPSGYAGGAR